MMRIVCTVTAPWPMDSEKVSREILIIEEGNIVESLELPFEWGQTIRSVVRYDGREKGYIFTSDAEIVRTNESFIPLSRFSSPRLNDVHDAIQWNGGTIISNTGMDEVLFLNGNNDLQVLFDMKERFGPSEVPLLNDNRWRCYDTRLHASHVNRVRPYVNVSYDGLLVSVFKTGIASRQGAIMLLSQTGETLWDISGKDFHGNHGPCPIPGGRSTFATCSSFAGRIVEFHQTHGITKIWGDFAFPKDVIALDRHTFIVADSGNDRVVCCRSSGQNLWEVRCPGSPYSLERCW